jgi:hypothetical protein
MLFVSMLKIWIRARRNCAQLAARYFVAALMVQTHTENRPAELKRVLRPSVLPLALRRLTLFPRGPDSVSGWRYLRSRHSRGCEVA